MQSIQILFHASNFYKTLANVLQLPGVKNQEKRKRFSEEPLLPPQVSSFDNLFLLRRNWQEGMHSQLCQLNNILACLPWPRPHVPSQPVVSSDRLLLLKYVRSSGSSYGKREIGGRIRGLGRKILHLLAYSANGCTSQGWTRNSYFWVAGIRHMGHLLLPPVSVRKSRNLGWKQSSWNLSHCSQGMLASWAAGGLTHHTITPPPFPQ